MGFLQNDDDADKKRRTLRPLVTRLWEPRTKMKWLDDAACAGMDPGVFFPDNHHEYGPAVKVCGDCRVTQECLDFALSNDEGDGVWGGLTPQDRRLVRRQRRKAER